jgi:tetratricopeptide (TPR) repeat protein
LAPTRKVFISYSHKDQEWVRGWLLRRLEDAGILVHIDFRDFEFGVASLINMERAVEECAKTLWVLTPNWIDSEPAQFEAAMAQTADPLGLRKRILPLMLQDCRLPRRIGMLTYVDFRDRSNWECQFERMVDQIREDFARLVPQGMGFPPLDPNSIDVSRLPQTGYELFGRQKELGILDEAWGSGDVHVVSFVAYGGTGKSTLVNKWIEKLRWDNYRGAKHVYGWSFYSQGTGDRATSADQFIGEALKWFGDPDPTKGSPWNKGRRLAELICQQKTLLVLDGLEPLQSGYDFEKGRIKDPALLTVVTQLAKKNKGLCVITTRQRIAELDRCQSTARQVGLEQISREAGRSLLRIGGVQGTDQELEAASEAFGNHALAVSLLAAYLHGIRGHHIAHVRDIPRLRIPEEKGRHPRRVIEAFERRFGRGPQTQVLGIMGLFDRPAQIEAIEAVKSAPAIAGLTDRLQDLSEGQWRDLLDEMRGCRLLYAKSRHQPNIVDCHPFVREHYGHKLEKGNADALRQAHSRLHDYYQGLPERLYGKVLPDTLEEMEPLFMSVEHACRAGRCQEAFGSVYFPRIQRGRSHYCWHRLGAFGATLAGLAAFVDPSLSRITTPVAPTAASSILGDIGVCLRHLGRLSEAVSTMRGALELAVAQGHGLNATLGALNLSQMLLLMGELDEAKEQATGSTVYADEIGDLLQGIVARASLGNVLHQLGQLNDALHEFQIAENMSRQPFGHFPILWSLHGQQYCDLLLSRGKSEDVLKRAKWTLELAERMRWVLDIPREHLCLAQAYLMRAVRDGGRSYAQAGHHVEEAVCASAENGERECHLRALMTRACLHRLQSKSAADAWADLAEAREIMDLGQMHLYLLDYHLEVGRLCLVEGGRLKEAREHLEEAATRVVKMSYQRRYPEVLLVLAEVEFSEDHRTEAKKTLKSAEKRIDEMGCYCWDFEVERLHKKFG